MEFLAVEYVSGDVLAVKWDDRPIRIIQVDPVETFYDVEGGEAGWHLQRVRTAIFYRISTDYLRTNSSIIGSQPLSPNETDRLRPDLPMRLFRHPGADWSHDPQSILAHEPNRPLHAQRIAVIPFGAKGGATRAHRVSDANGLNLWRLVEEALQVQQVSCAGVEGVGIYRSGIVANTPSYYLWGAVDRAGHAI